MEHQIHLNAVAFKTYELKAKLVGLTVEEYLNESANHHEGMSPQMRQAIEIGLAQADAGDLVGMAQVRESLTQYKSTWRQNKLR